MPTLHTPRPVRVTTPAIEVRLAREFGSLLNISATGALLRIHSELPVGREYPLILNMPDGPIPLTVRVMRARATSAGLPEGTDDPPECLIGVRFTEVSSKAMQTVAKLCGPALHERE